MKVCIELPSADSFSAGAFGLWLKSVLDDARDSGELDTEVGEIKVTP